MSLSDGTLDEEMRPDILLTGTAYSVQSMYGIPFEESKSPSTPSCSFTGRGTGSGTAISLANYVILSSLSCAIMLFIE